MKTWYLALVGLAATLILAPAVVAGGGFVLAAVLLVVLALVALIGPKGARMWWEQHLTRSQGENAGMQLRDLVGGHNQRPGDRSVDAGSSKDRWGKQ